MDFFLDENFPKLAVPLLESLGHRVHDIRGTCREGCDDRAIFESAQQVGAIFLTTDRDFYHTVPRFYPEHAGIVVIALSQPNGPAILEKLRLAINMLLEIRIASSVLLLKDRMAFTRR